MSRKFLFVMLAIAIAFGMTVTGCNEPDEEGFKNHTLNLKDSGANSVTLTVKGAKWKNFTGSSAANEVTQALFLEKLMEWTSTSGSIDSFTYINKDFSLEKDNKLKIVFTKYSVAGVGITGSGTVTLQNLSTADLMISLALFTDGMDKAIDWTIGTNDKVTITIN
jgi:hypothetical protein